MTKDINSVRLKGVIGNIDYRANNVASIQIATNSYYNETKAKTEWHSVVAFNQLGLKLKELGAQKGTRIMLDGSLRLNAWTDKDGKEHRSTEIVASDLEVLAVKPKVEQKQAANQVGAVPVQVQQQQYAGGGYVEY